MSSFQNLKPELIVRDKDSWDILWQRAVAYYWDNMASCDEQRDNKLYFILNQLGVKNMVNEGKGIVAFKAFATGPDGSAASAPNILKVRIKDNNRQEPAKYVWQEAFTSTNSWRNLAIDLTVKLPPIMSDDYAANSASILSEFVAMGLYFPFGEKFDTAYDDNSAQSQHFEGNHLPRSLFDPGVHAQPGAGVRAPSPGALHENEISGMGQKGDRGGAEGLDDDYRWINFVPRMVAYNWSVAEGERIKPNASLSQYPELLKNLGFEIPRGLNIIIDYASYLPSEHGQFNINDYTSILSIDFPSPPQKEGYNPIALADLIAQRGNQPFTCS